MINIMDAVIILFLLMGAVLGFKRGAIQSICVLVGTIFIIVLAFILKNPLASLMYTYLPFFKLSGIFSGISVISILIYEAIAFLIILTILGTLLSIILKITGIISKIVDYSIILTLPSKIIGMIIGIAESYIFLVIFLFIFSQFSFSNEVLSSSKLTDAMLKNTPLENINNSYKAFNDIKNINKVKLDDDKANCEALNTLLKYDVLSTENANKLVENGKLDFKNAKKVIESYEE